MHNSENENTSAPVTDQHAGAFRFAIYRGRIETDGKFVKTRDAGHAFLNSGRHVYRVKLFALPSFRYFAVPSRSNPEEYKIVIPQEVRSKKDKSVKTFWNVVGEGQVLSQQGILKLKFDLLSEPVYMNLFPVNGGNVLPFRVDPEWPTLEAA